MLKTGEADDRSDDLRKVNFDLFILVLYEQVFCVCMFFCLLLSFIVD